ncbi:hypothetical protein OSCI_3090012 [Kamptonema sp. PCC 6506]|nr:hypothetical protein OSCI_3090012 [Kamptonema sp. PCC 6506]
MAFCLHSLPLVLLPQQLAAESKGAAVRGGSRHRTWWLDGWLWFDYHLADLLRIVKYSKGLSLGLKGA